MINIKINLLLVGFGAMGKALYTCWQGAKLANIAVIDPFSEESTAYKSIEDLPDSFIPNVIVLAVKPQVMAEIVPLYKHFQRFNTVYISIAAGKSMEEIESYLGEGTLVIRAMPNLPATVGQGLTGLYSNQLLPDALKLGIDQLFASVGQVLWLESEDQVNLVTAISGSGPAYFYRLVECLIKSGQALGLSASAAQLLAEQTFIGAAELLKKSNQSAMGLRQQVTSPGGTTAAALTVFDNQECLDILVSTAINAAVERAKELSR